MKRKKYTVVECILLAAKSLSDLSGTFSAEDLVVRAWDLFPDQFGLQGYASKYPDSNRVLTKIMVRCGSRSRSSVSSSGNFSSFDGK